MKWGSATFLIALLLPLFSFSQDVQVYDPEGPSAEASTIPSQQDGKNLDSSIEEDFDELEKDLAAQSKAMNAVSGILESPAEKRDRLNAEKAAKPDNEPEIPKNKELHELQSAMNGGKSSLDVLRDPALRKKLIAAYENNPMVGMPREMLKSNIQAQIEKSPLAGVVRKFPKLLDFLVDLMRHPRALAQAVKVLNRMDDLKNCGYVSIALMVLVFFLRKILINRRTKFFKRVFIGLSTSLLMTMGSLGFLWFMFEQELGPTVEVFRQTFFA